jgi:hypothetical protein
MRTVKILLKVFFVLLLLLFLFLTSIYYNDKFYKSAIKLSIENPYFLKPLEFLDNIYNELDINRYIQRENLSENKIYRIQFSGSDVKKVKEQIELFKEVGYIKDELNVWRKATVVINNKEQKVKFKLHGTSISPLANDNGFSLRIKHKKEGNYYNLMREYSLLSSKDDLDISTISINNIASEFGLLAPYGEMVITKINNVPIGMFMLVEHHGKEWFERNHQMTNYSILKSNDDWDRKENTSGTAHISNSDKLVNNKEVKTTSLKSSEALGALHNLFEAIEDNNIDEVKELVDIDYAARFMAISVLANNAHPLAGDNFKFIYDHTSGRFKFLFRIEDTIKPINSSLLDFNSSWFLSYFVSSDNFDLFKMLTSDSSFRNLRDKYLIQLVLAKENILSKANTVFDSNNEVLLQSEIPLRRESIKKRDYLNNLDNNLKRIEEYLNYGKVFVTISSTSQDKYQLSVLNDSYVPILANEAYYNAGSEAEVKPQVLKNFKGIYINSPDLDINLNQINTPIEISISTDKKISDLIFKNEITGKTIPNKNVYINYSSKIVNLSDAQLIDNLELSGLDFSIEKDKIIIQKGVFNITQNTIFPKTKKLILSAGVNFLLDAGTSILIQSDLLVNGTKEEPVSIRRLTNKEPFGVFAVIGREKIAEVGLNNFHISGGGESSVNGINFLGQLSVHNADVKINDSSIKGSSSDDGMNIRNSKVLITNSLFESNFADQIDLDFCIGELSNNLFRFNSDKTGNMDPNGDGLDVSGSKVIVESNIFEGFLDKALSIGENSSVLLRDNSFQQNLRAITVKDGSSAYILDNEFNKNTYDLSLYIKKRFYKEPKIYINSKVSGLSINNQLKEKLNSVNMLSSESIISKYEER